jgi:glycogen operon protein
MNHWIPEEGLSFPFGATWNNELQGFNFALYSKAASKLELYFFKKDAPSQVVFLFSFDPIKNKTSTIWHCFIKESALNGADSYAYRADGAAGEGNNFDYLKLLTDPWAKAVYFPPTFSRTAAVFNGDNIGRAALGLLIKRDTNPVNFEADKSPVHYHDLIIYEMHVRGFTQHNSSGVSNQFKGTFSGVVEKIPYLLDLGITAVELMPVYQFDPQEGNYWGYMTLNFFAPHHLYGSTNDSWELVKEFKAMVMALHNAGIEVILDVIYNHSVEGGKQGPTYSFKGIDNSSYYLLTPDLQHYVDDAGTGNVMRTSRKIVRKLVLDSLRYWVTEMHVDGFRFDLAAIFTRNDDTTINLVNPALLEEISMDPILSKVRLIAEPWDIASFQLGRKFPGASWAQWNGAFRDDIRKFIKGDENMVATMMTRIYGSPDLFPETPPFNDKPWQSINFITSHDGFSLYDLVAYNKKHNEVNGFNNTDGSNDNHSWNCDWEGDNNVPQEIIELRKKQAKNLMTIMMFSNGIPMFRMGDEFLLTQNGNNNPFNQDNEISWVDWNRKNQFDDFFRFTKMLIDVRKSHPSICRGNFWNSDVQWHGANGGQADISYFSRTLAYHIKGGSMNDNDFYIMINCYWQPLNFQVPFNINGWKKIIDTSLNSPDDINKFENSPRLLATGTIIQGRSIVVLQKEI